MVYLKQSVVIKQALKLNQILSPKLIQMLQAFAYSYSDVLSRVSREVEDNVVLEIKQYDQLLDYASSRKSSSITASGDYLDISTQAKSRSPTDHLVLFLLSQLDLETLSEKDDAMARYLVSNIDDRGYIENYTQIKEEIKAKFGVDDRKVLSILKVVQSLEPDGVGARSVKECLMIQVDAHHFEHEKLRETFREVIQSHLDDLAAERFDVIAEALEIPLDGVSVVAEFIRSNLKPYPGLAYGAGPQVQSAIPSFEVVLDGDQVDINQLEATKGVQLGISDRYLAMLSDASIDDDSRTYIQERVKRAQELIDTIHNRQRLMADLVRTIVVHQIEFFKNGVYYLAPLHQKELAEKMGMSPSTISRILSSKYIVTPFGMMTLKQLCPRSHFGMTAHRLQELVKAVCIEFPQKSDREISHVLGIRGMQIARRTVAKYRLAVGITRTE